MGWISDRLAVLGEAAGPRRYVIGGTITVAVTVADYFKPILGNYGMSELIGIPSWVAGLIVALIIVSYWLLEFAVRLHRRGRGVRLQLANLRHEGVNLRNSARKIPDGAVNDWIGETKKWNLRVIDCLKTINEADAVWFSVLDTVPPSRHEPDVRKLTDDKLKAEFMKAFREHDFRLLRLGTLVQNEKYEAG